MVGPRARVKVHMMFVLTGPTALVKAITMRGAGAPVRSDRMSVSTRPRAVVNGTRCPF